ncbi:MAG: hypothetical protein OXP74_01910 [Acidobacteriota bacterium]|nr:hypothetical protein [Acidobacteriota bacterium]
MRLGVCLTKDGRDLVGALRDVARELDELTRAARRAGGVAHRYVAASRAVAQTRVSGVLQQIVRSRKEASAERFRHVVQHLRLLRDVTGDAAPQTGVAGRGDVISPSIHVTVETSAGGDANGFGPELGLRIRRELEPLIRDVMVNERRPGGVLNPTDRIHV